MQTSNNIKNCALAMHAYHDNYKRFPDAFNLVGIPPKPGTYPLWVAILPFIEQDQLFRNINSASISTVPPYLAPSDLSNTDNVAALNYAANLRIFANKSLLDAEQPVNEPGKALTVPAGILLCRMTLGQFPDGTTNTIMLTTRYATCDGKRTFWAAGVNGESEPGALPGPGVGGFMGAGSHSAPATAAKDGDATFQIAPREFDCLPNPGVFGHSFGAGGMSVALVDGSVRNIMPTMSPLTFGRALCPADGEKMLPDWFDD